MKKFLLLLTLLVSCFFTVNSQILRSENFYERTVGYDEVVLVDQEAYIEITDEGFNLGIKPYIFQYVLDDTNSDSTYFVNGEKINVYKTYLIGEEEVSTCLVHRADVLKGEVGIIIVIEFSDKIYYFNFLPMKDDELEQI